MVNLIYCRYAEIGSFHSRLQSGWPCATGAHDHRNMIYASSINPFHATEWSLLFSILLETVLLVSILFVSNFVNMVCRVKGWYKHHYSLHIIEGIGWNLLTDMYTPQKRNESKFYSPTSPDFIRLVQRDVLVCGDALDNGIASRCPLSKRITGVAQ